LPLRDFVLEEGFKGVPDADVANVLYCFNLLVVAPSNAKILGYLYLRFVCSIAS
jgi:hypothetical protein